MFCGSAQPSLSTVVPPFGPRSTSATERLLAGASNDTSSRTDARPESVSRCDSGGVRYSSRWADRDLSASSSTEKLAHR